MDAHDHEHDHDELTIGEVARATGLTAKALRLYDDAGLLVPARVDDVTGYRYYRPAQLDRARLVARLRLAGMPLARIREVVDAPPGAAAVAVGSWWRQVEADRVSTGRLVERLVRDLAGTETGMTPTIATNPDPTTRTAPAVRTGTGRRPTQEDAVRSLGDLHVISDGVAAVPGVSRAALDALPEPPPGGDPVAYLDDALAAASAAVARRFPGQAEAACTLTALLLLPGRVAVAHLGDSRAHLVRDGSLTRLTRDHTVVQSLLDEGRLTEEEARADERRVVINRAVTGGGEHPPDVALHAVRPGDRLVLTTDGVHGLVEPAALAGLLTGPGPVDAVADAVAHAVEAAGPEDNWAVLVVDVP